MSAKISALTDVGTIAATDKIPILRAGANRQASVGSMAAQASTAVSITGGTVTGITDLAVADGGTGASDAATARTNLGLGTIATQDANAVTISGGAITGITDLAVADGGTGASTAANARTNLGLGTIATQDASAVAITGGTVTGITDLAVADGGTGASSKVTARTNLGFGKNSDIASAATTDLANATDEMVDITGSTTITSFGTVASGLEFVLRFTGAPLVTYNATSLILPGAASIQMQAGDVMHVRSLGSGNWVATDVTPTDRRTRDLSWEVPCDAADTFTLRMNASKAYTVVSATTKTTASTVTAALKIDGTNITSLSALACTTAEATTAASGANAAAAGSDLTVVLSSPGTSGSRLILTIKTLERA